MKENKDISIRNIGKTKLLVVVPLKKPKLFIHYLNISAAEQYCEERRDEQIDCKRAEEFDRARAVYKAVATFEAKILKSRLCEHKLHIWFEFSTKKQRSTCKKALPEMICSM